MYASARIGVRACVSECMCVCEFAGRFCAAELTAMLAAPQDGETPLCYASSNGRSEVVRALLAKGADVEAKNKVTIVLLRPAHSRPC